MMSPLTQRKLRNFMSNRRGFYAAIVFIVMFFIAMFAEFIANDKPIILAYNQKIYFPVFKQYSEKFFGGDFDTEADYKDAYVKDLIESKGGGWMLWPILKYSYKTINYDLPRPAPSAPSAENILGTDDQGRDVLARTIYGFRISVLFGLILTIFSSIVGIAAGAVQGYYGGKIDLFFQRFIEIWSGLPVLFILIILASLVTPNFWWMLGIMLLFSWTSLVRVVRAEFLKARNYEYVKAAKALGVKEAVVVFRHVLPNAFVSALTFMPFILTGAITTLTSLDFLGFGLPPGSPSLGELLSQGKTNLEAPWLGMTAFLVLAVMLSLLIFIGEAVRDTLDPRKV